MGTVLITGASGFIGRALAESLRQSMDIVCMSRRHPNVDAPWVRGEFQSFEDLQELNDYDITGVVHLGAVTGGCLERDGILVNVEGSRCLMRYLMDSGCRKFVMASSIAAVGMQSTLFRPLSLPIPDDHLCLDRDGYGVSKHLMEEITHYHSRQNPEIEVTNLRLASIIPDENPPAPGSLRPLGEWALGGITQMCLSDAVRAFSLALTTTLGPGVHTLNATAPRAWVSEPVATILRNWYGDAVDVSYFERPGNAYAAVYDVTQIRERLGFVAERLPGDLFPGSQSV